MVATSLFAMNFQVNVDVYLDLKYNFYGYYQEGPDYLSLIYLFGIYPAINIVYLNYFPYKKKFMKKVFYLAMWVLFAGVFELIFLWTKTFYYHDWKFFYSIIIYPFAYLILNGFHKYLRYLLKKELR